MNVSTRWLLLTILTAAVIATASRAADADLKVSEVEKLRIINAYQSAVIAQVDSARANEAVQKAIGTYNAVLDETRKAHAWPEGTQIQMTPDRADVTVTIPPPKPAEATKPAAPPPKK